jgi:hypothetical protein
MQQSQIHFFQLMRFRDFEPEGGKNRSNRPMAARSTGSTKIKHMLRPNR